MVRVSSKGLIAGGCTGKYKDKTKAEKRVINDQLRPDDFYAKKAKANKKSNANISKAGAAAKKIKSDSIISGGPPPTDVEMRPALKELGHSDSAINALETIKKSNDKTSGQRSAVGAAYKGMGGSGLINDEHTAALVAKGLKPSAINSFNRRVERNAEISAARIEASIACAAKYDPEETAKHMNYLNNIPEIAHNIIEANEVLYNIYNRIEGWDNSVVNICAFRTSSDLKLDRQKQEWSSFAHDRTPDTFPIITEHDGTPLSQERLLALGFEHGILKCTFPTDDGGSVLPTLSKHVNNALEKELHDKFAWLPENRRLWVDAGKGGVGASRTTLNNMFVDCNLPPREEVEDKKAWDEEKATFEVQTNFTFTVAYVYRKDGLPDEVKFQLDPVTHRRRKKPSGGAAATTTTTTTSNSTRNAIVATTTTTTATTAATAV